MATISKSQPPLTISYLRLRKIIGILGAGFPFILLFGGYFIYSLELQTSFSAYYHTPMRDVFVGMLCAIGVFLFSYRGYSKSDHIISILTGIFAIGTALFPIDMGEPMETSIVEIAHLSFASSYFLLLAYFCLRIFTKTPDTSAMSVHKKWRNRIYTSCGYTILISLLLLITTPLLPHNIEVGLQSISTTFWLESIATIAFGVSWFTKGKGILAGGKQ